LPQGRLTLPALLKMAGLFALPMLLVLKQPDLSTALSYLPILAIGVFLAGVPWKYVAAAAAIAVLVLPLGWQHMKPYQQDRVLTFMNPDRDPLGSGYQPIQSKIAVGSGGIWGRGFARGEQTQLRFLPVPHTDFVFSAYSEETGFIGVVFVVVVSGDSDENRHQRADRVRYRRRDDLHGFGGGDLVSHRSQYRDGDRPHAGDRHSLAVDELRRVASADRLPDVGSG
jgi:hypothetical protein